MSQELILLTNCKHSCPQFSNLSFHKHLNFSIVVNLSSTSKPQCFLHPQNTVFSSLHSWGLLHGSFLSCLLQPNLPPVLLSVASFTSYFKENTPIPATHYVSRTNPVFHYRQTLIILSHLPEITTPEILKILPSH